MRCIEIARAGRTGGPAARRASGSGAGGRRGADRRRRGRRQSSGRAAAAGRVSAAAGRQRPSRARGRPGTSRPSGRVCTDGAWATRCARWWPAAATPRRCVAPAPQCLPVPAGVTLVEAAARCPRRASPSGPTCSSAGRCERGETALFHGGTSGIGTTAIQLAVARGARVLATAGSDEKCARVRGAWRRARHQLPYDRLRRRGAGADRRARRRSGARHHGWLLRGAEPGGAGDRTAGWCRSG